MDVVRIDHPTGKPNFTTVRLQNVTLAFSYQTLIAVLLPHSLENVPEEYLGRWVVSENVWSTTTGKHLNHIDPDKKNRVPWEEFALLVDGLRVVVDFPQGNPNRIQQETQQ